MNKSQLRKKLLQHRRSLSKSEVKTASEFCCLQLLQLDHFKQAKNIAVYFAINNEIDLALFIDEAIKKNKTLYLPCLADQQLIFRHYQPDQPLIKNKFSIFEPSRTAKIMFPENLDLVITPLVAVDKKGYRLGMGGGYYDRSFAFLKNQKKIKPTLLGVAYDWQIIDSVDHNHWDICLDQVLFKTP